MKDIKLVNVEENKIYMSEQYQGSNRYFIRQEELKTFLLKMDKFPYGKYAIYGLSGMGKTAFLHMIAHELKNKDEAWNFRKK